MATPPPVTSRPHFTEAETTWAFVIGGGITLLILAFALAAVRGDGNGGPGILLLGGIALVVSGIVLWAVTLRPWEKFDDLTTPYYIGHAHDHATDHAPDQVSIENAIVNAEVAALSRITDSPDVNTGAPFADDFSHDDLVNLASVAGHESLAVNAPAQVEPHPMETVGNTLPPPPEFMEPMSAFPEPTPAPATPRQQVEPHPGVDAAPVAISVPATQDDLSLIKGIGPKITKALHDAEIFTFAQLAAKTPAELEAAARAGGAKSVINPASWIADAKKVLEGDASALQDTEEAHKFD